MLGAARLVSFRPIDRRVIQLTSVHLRPQQFSVCAQVAPAATCHWGGLNLWCSDPASPGVLSPRPTAKGSPPPPPMAPEVPMYPPPVVLAPPPSVTAKGSPPPPDDVPARTATAKGSARLAAAKNSPPPANAEDAPAPAIDNILPTPGIDNLLPTPGIGKLSPSQEPGPDGFTVGIEDGEEPGQPLPIRPRPAKQYKVRQKPDTTEGRSAIQSLDDAEVEKLKPKLTICRGC